MKLDKRTYDKEFDSFILIGSRRLDENQVMADINVGGSKQLIMKSLIAAMHSNPILAVFIVESLIEIDNKKPLGKGLFEILAEGQAHLQKSSEIKGEDCTCEVCRVKNKMKNGEPLSEHEKKIVQDEIENQLGKILKSI